MKRGGSGRFPLWCAEKYFVLEKNGNKSDFVFSVDSIKNVEQDSQEEKLFTETKKKLDDNVKQILTITSLCGAARFALKRARR